MLNKTYGPLDARRMFVRGWSGGAQMVSWLVQLFASGYYDTLPGTTDTTRVPSPRPSDKHTRNVGVAGKGNLSIVGGVYLSGGSYNCYANPPNAHGNCQHCNASKKCATHFHSQGDAWSG